MGELLIISQDQQAGKTNSMGFSKIVSITVLALVILVAIWHNFIEQIELPFSTNKNMAHKAEFQEIKHMVRSQLNQIRNMAEILRAEFAELKSLRQSIQISYAYHRSNKAQNQKNIAKIQQNTTKYALLGDIGGTNIRFQIVEFSENQKLPLRIIKQRRMKVKDYQLFEDSVKEVLAQILTKQYPQVAVIAVAGPINQNSVVLSNVPRWGNMIGAQMASKFNISQFRFINDFQAASYGLMIIEDSEFVQLNGHSINENKMRGVIGPGTGLGHSIILKNQYVKNSIIVLPSQAGHGDFPLIDQETVHYFNFLKQNRKFDYFSLQSSFCGPTIPLMYQFFTHTQNLTSSLIQITSQNIIQECIRENPQPIFQKIIQLFMKIYSSAIANFMIQHMTTGGVYLIGGLTKTILPKIKGTDILKSWKQRHPQMAKLVESIPLIFCNQVDLGLKGAFVMAKQLSK